MPVSKYKKRLTALKANFKTAKNEADSMFGVLDIEPSVYNAQLSGIKFQDKKGSGELMCISNFLLTDGEKEGATLPIFFRPEDEANQPFFVRFVEILTGYEFPDDPADLEDMFETVIEEAPLCKVEVEKNPDKGEHEGRTFTNVNLIERLDEVPEGEPEATETEPEPEPEPEPEAEATEEEDTVLDKAKEFCECNDVEFEKDDTREIIAERIVAEFEAYEYEEGCLGEEEVSCFEELGIMEKVQKELKPKPKPKPAPKKKPVRKAKK